MTEEIRELLHRAPFIPFDICLADGRILHVPHPDYCWLTPRDNVFVARMDSDAVDRVAPRLITSLRGPEVESDAS